MKFILSSVLLLFTLVSQAQLINGIATRWSDDFIEWIIFTDEDDLEGEITMRWQMQRDWTEWDYSLGDASGSIRLKWANDPSQWEINGNDELITARMIWKGDPTEWRITNNKQTITLKSKWKNNFNEWQLKNGKYGEFDMETRWDDDPREWEIEEDLDDEISIHMKIAILFLVTYHSSPKD